MNFSIKIKHVFTLGLLLYVNYQTVAQDYKIGAKIKGAANLDAQLAYYQGENQVLVQTAKFDKNGEVSFAGEKKLPAGIYFLVVGKIGYFDLLIRDEQHFILASDTTNLINDMKVKNSKDNEIFFNYQKKVLKVKTQLAANEERIKLLDETNDSVAVYTKENDSLQTELSKLIENTEKEHPNSYLAKILHAMSLTDIDKLNFADEDLLRTPFFHNMIRNYIKRDIEKNPEYIKHSLSQLLDSVKNTEANYQYVVTYLLNFYNTFYKVGMNDVFVFLADNYFLPDKAKWLNESVLKQIKERRDFLAQSLPGAQAQDLKVESNTGEYFSLLQVESPVTFLYFWSADCGHCTKSTAILKANYDALKEKNIAIFAVNIDKDKDKWLKKIEETESPWLNCWDPDEVSDFRDKYYVYGTPLLYVIGPNKKIIAKKHGEEEIEELVNKIKE